MNRKMKLETPFQVQERLTVTFCNEQEDETGNELSSTRSPEIQQEKFMLAQSNVIGIPIGKRGEQSWCIESMHIRIQSPLISTTCSPSLHVMVHLWTGSAMTSTTKRGEQSWCIESMHIRIQSPLHLHYMLTQPAHDMVHLWQEVLWLRQRAHLQPHSQNPFSVRQNLERRAWVQG